MAKITDRIDKVTAIPESHRSVTPPAPRSVKIEVTGRCDFKCFFCAGRQGLRKVGHMDRKLFSRVIREFRSSGVEELGLFYLGESFVLPWLPDLIREAKQDVGYPYVFLTTNGRLASPERVELCIRAGLDSLKFSFNNADGRQLHEVCGVPAKWFEEILFNIERTREVRDDIERATGHRCGLYASSIQFDGEQLEKMTATVKRILPFVDEHYWLPLYNQGDLTTKDCEERGLKPTAGNRGRIGALREPIPCWALFTEGHVTFDGMLSGCCFDHSSAWHMGDLKSQNFMEAWHSNPFQELRARHLARDIRGTPCDKCAAYS